MSAPLEDDVLGDDPTVHKSEEKIADMLGKEDALFVPSGTIQSDCTLDSKQTSRWRGTSQTAHIYVYEATGPAVLSGLLLKTVGGANGIIDLDELSATVPPDDPHFAPLSIVCAEDTANKGGGTVYPLDTLDAVGQFARKWCQVSLGRTRLFNAVMMRSLC